MAAPLYVQLIPSVFHFITLHFISFHFLVCFWFRPMELRVVCAVAPSSGEGSPRQAKRQEGNGCHGDVSAANQETLAAQMPFWREDERGWGGRGGGAVTAFLSVFCLQAYFAHVCLQPPPETSSIYTPIPIRLHSQSYNLTNRCLESLPCLC